MSVRPHAEHVKQVSAHPSKCLDLGLIRLLDFPEYEDAAYNRDHFIKFAINVTGKRGGDTACVVKRYKAQYAPEGYPPEPYLNGIAQAYRCHKKEGFLVDKKITIDVR